MVPDDLVRSSDSSPLLFWTIIAISCAHQDRVLYRNLQPAVCRLIGEILHSPTSDLRGCQALCLLCIYRFEAENPNDDPTQRICRTCKPPCFSKRSPSAGTYLRVDNGRGSQCQGMSLSLFDKRIDSEELSLFPVHSLWLERTLYGYVSVLSCSQLWLFDSSFCRPPFQHLSRCLGLGLG